MKHTQWIVSGLVLALLAGCGGPAQDGGDGAADAGPGSEEDATGGAQTAGESTGMEGAMPGTESASGGATGEETEIVPGLTMRVLQPGTGETAETGHTAVVHYTGWLHDAEAPGNRGEKFDSSVDRGEPFEFSLGAGQVITGWDQGVVGMQVGELRELTIAPELAYGERGAGDVIPPGATLVFEVELIELRGSGTS